MQFRYGVLNLLRSWRKTLAFFLLLSVLTAALGLSAGVCQTAADFLTQCEDNYVTIAQVEYKAAQMRPTDCSPKAVEAAQALALPEYVQ